MNTEEFLKDAVAVCEATDFEKQILWERWHERIVWDSHARGLLTYVTKTDTPTCISLWADIIGGKKVIFWHATSLYVDFASIELWLESNLPWLNRYQTDAQNFHIIVHDIERMNKTPKEREFLTAKVES